MRRTFQFAIVSAAIAALIFASTGSAGQSSKKPLKGNPFKFQKTYKAADCGKPKPPQPTCNKPPAQCTNTPPTTTTATTYGGQAVAFDLTNTHSGLHWIVGDTGGLLSVGGAIDVNVGATNLNKVIHIDGASVSTTASGGVVTSEAEIHAFSSTFVNYQGVTVTISFDFAEAKAVAQCDSKGMASVTGSSQIQGLVINGTAVNVTGTANQVVTFAGGTVVINAQVTSSAGSESKISVASLFITLDGCFTGPIGFAEAAISCGTKTPPPPPPPAPGGTNAPCGKITGGGFIIGTPSGAKGSFGVSGGIRRGQFWGHLNYIDHGTGMHVKSTAVTGFTVIDAVTRQIDYNVDIDGAAGTATVICADNGEPGRDDIFDITLSTGYHAGGDLGGPGHGGGNIQLHKCPPGWQK